MKGAEGTLYEGEMFQLQFKFSPKYPFDSPEVSTCKSTFTKVTKVSRLVRLLSVNENKIRFKTFNYILILEIVCNKQKP